MAAAALLISATPVPAAHASTTIDIRGDWAEQSHYGGTSSYVMHWTTQDCSSGVVSGTGGQPGSDQWSMSGTINGNHLVFTETYYGLGYTSTEDVTVAADGNSYSGTFRDSNGTTGTITAQRTSGPPAGGCGGSGGGGGGGGTAGKHPTGTSVFCNFDTLTAVDTCYATVADAGTPASPPTGTVRFTSANEGIFRAGDTCTLAVSSGSTSRCSVEFIPPLSGFPQLTASYSGDGTHEPSVGHTEFLVLVAPGSSPTTCRVPRAGAAQSGGSKPPTHPGFPIDAEKCSQKAYHSGFGAALIDGGLFEVAVGSGSMITGGGLAQNPSPLVVAVGTGLSFGGAISIANGSLAIAVGKNEMTYAQDPPDPNFRKLVRPKVRGILRVRVGGKDGRRLTRQARRLLVLDARTAALARAASVSLERAAGAAAAGDRRWERRQMLAVAQYARRQSTLLTKVVKARQQIARTFRRPPWSRAKVGLKDAQRVQRRLRTGFPARVETQLRRAGLSRSQIRSLRADMIAASPRDLVVRSLASTFVSKKTLRALRFGARLLKGLARRVTANPRYGEL